MLNLSDLKIVDISEIPVKLDKKESRRINYKKYYQKNKKCISKKQKLYYLKNKEKIMKRSTLWNKNHKNHRLQYMRNSYLRFNGKSIRVKKRDFPKNNKCELCNKNYNRLYYHHWNDNNLELGIWSCCKCHRIVETIDDIEFTKKITNKYLNLKQIIEFEYGKTLNT